MGEIGDSRKDNEERSEVDAALAAFGLVAIQEKEDLEPLYLWPENLVAWGLFQALSTQWDVSDGVRIGLKYQSVKIVMKLRGIPRRERQRHFDLIQKMEEAALEAWQELRDNG